jgi:cytochrome P450
MATTIADDRATEARTDSVPTSIPPGPPLPRPLQTCLIWSFPRQYLEACQRRYGHTFTLRTVEFGEMVYVTREEDVKTVFTGDPEVFHAGEGNSVLIPLMGDRSILMLEEAEHLMQRRRLSPPFHGESVKRYRDVVREVTEAELETWPVGEPFAVHPHMGRLALDIIIRAVLGVDDPARVAELRERLRASLEITAPAMVMWQSSLLRDRGPAKRQNARIAAADEMIYDEIRRHRADPHLDERQDVLSLLIREAGDVLTDRDLRDNLTTLLVAGHESTATELAWAFERLSRHPRVLRRLEESLHDEDEAYLDAVVKETLRTRPVFINVVRKLTRPVELAGHRLPAGVNVLPGIELTHLDPRYFGDPEEFRPERFLDGEGSNYTWIPFGGGTRRCLGAAFASVEMKVVLRTVLSHRELATTSAPAERPCTKHITHIPGRGARIALRPRAASVA